ncbi:TAP42-like protein [Phlyctochytrium arcticum]|nr:TAP42-like protein [Phlyctochytrium arcticum]
MAATDALPLKTEFHNATTLYHALEDSPLASADPAYQKDVHTAITSLARCATLIDTIGIFSTNEILEDVNTGDLRFLLVDAYLGDLIYKSMGRDRLDILKDSQMHYERFLATCEQHEILSKEDRKFLEIQMKGGIPDPDRRRTEKIARFKREKATKDKIKQLHDQIALQAKPAHTDPDAIDEELDRDIILTTVDLFIQRTIENLTLIVDERALLERMAKARLEMGPVERSERESGDDSRLDSHPPPQMKHQGPLMAQDGKILRPFTLTSQRNALLNQVFQPGHTLPSLSVEEYLEREMERGNFLSGGTNEDMAAAAVLHNEEDEAAADAETMKQREWDEFKDVTPKGWGNRYNKG